MTMHPFSSFNQARAIADKYARANERTMYVVYEGTLLSKLAENTAR